MIETFVDWLVNLIQTLGYPGVALSMFLESFFAPIPSEMILPFSGFVASTGTLNIFLVIIVASLAAFLGSLPFYFLGVWGQDWVNNFLEKWGKYLFISHDDVNKAYEAFDKYGNKFVLFGRLIPIVRTLISFPAGVSKMPFGLFSLYTLIGTFAWSALLAYAGFLLGNKWEIVVEYLAEYEKIIIGAVILVFVAYIGRGVYKMFKKEVK